MNAYETPYPFVTQALARRLEGAEAHGNAKFVEARARLFPESGAQWIEVAGAFAMFDGESSALTQTFGLGMFDKVTAAEMEALEGFFQQRRAPVYHEISPLADSTLLPLLVERSYRPMEFTSVLYRPIRRHEHLQAPRNDRIRVRVAGNQDHDLWTQTASRGWGEFAGLADFMLEVGPIMTASEGALPFLAELDGQAIAAGMLSIHDGVALLAGASTIPEARRQGAQLALLDSRLNYAAEQGCDLAMMGALPGSASQRNAERHGFRIAYTRIKWRLHEPTK